MPQLTTVTRYLARSSFLPHTLHAVLYVGKDKTSFVKEGKNWRMVCTMLLQEFRTLLQPTAYALGSPLHRQQGSTVAVDGSYCEQDHNAHIGWSFRNLARGGPIDGQAGSISHPDALSLRNVAGSVTRSNRSSEWCRAHDCTETSRFGLTTPASPIGRTAMWRTNAVRHNAIVSEWHPPESASHGPKNPGA